MYPTDTLYGLGADATNDTAVAAVRTIKGRDDIKPILAMVSGIAMLEQYAVVTPLARRVAEKFLPGQVTLVLHSRNDVLRPVAAPDGSVGFRMPNHSFCLALVEQFGKPVTSTSVNRAGSKPPRTPEEMLGQLGVEVSHIECVVDAGVLPTLLPSTILDVRGDLLVVVREGAVRAQEIHSALSV